MPGIDFSTCTLNQLQIDTASLYKIKVNLYQAADLSKILGLEIVE